MSIPAIVVSDVESARFGMRIARARFDVDQADHGLASELTANDVDLLILRVPAGAHDLPRGLIESGLRVVHADTLVYYGASIRDWIPGADPAPEAAFSVATAAHRGPVEAIARRSFAGYRSHYQATPGLDQALVAEGYAEWAASYASGTGPGRLTYVIEQAGEVVGFVAASLDEASGICDVVLNAVHPEYEGRGLYRAALGRLVAHALRLGYDRATISTQIWNYRVQRVWTRCGMALTHAYDTYHVSQPPPAAAAMSIAAPGALP